MEEGNVKQTGNKRPYNEEDNDCKSDAKRQNVERQRKYIECLKTPEKKSELVAYKQKRAAMKREYQRKKRNDRNNCASEGDPTLQSVKHDQPDSNVEMK